MISRTRRVPYLVCLWIAAITLVLGPLGHAALGLEAETTGRPPERPVALAMTPAHAGQLVSYALEVDFKGSGNVDRDPHHDLYEVGTTVELTALPASGWRFEGWTGDLSGDDNPATLVMTINRSVTAHFQPDAAYPEPVVHVTGQQTELNLGETDTITVTVTNEGAEQANGWGIQVRASDGLTLVEDPAHPLDDTPCAGAAEWRSLTSLSPGASASVAVGVRGEAVGSSATVSYTAWLTDADGVPVAVQYAHPVGALPCDRAYAGYSVRVLGELTTKAQRADAIQDAVRRLRGEYDLPPDLTPAEEEGIILAIAAQECGGHGFDNEILSGDWGRGVMQITYPDSYVGSGNADPCDVGSDCYLCRRGGALWRECRTSPAACLMYEAIEGQARAACAAYYANTQTGIDRNIRDGLYVLEEKHGWNIPQNIQSAVSPSGLNVSAEELGWMIVASRYGPDYTGYGQGPLFYVRLLGGHLQSGLVDHYGPDQAPLPELGARFADACARRSELDGTGVLQVWDGSGNVTGQDGGTARAQVANSEYFASLQRVNLFLPDQAHHHRVVGTETAAYDLTLTSGCEGLSALSGQATAGELALTLESVAIADAEVHDYVVDWTASPLSATRKTDADGDGEFEGFKTIRPPHAALTYSPQAPGQASLITFDASGSTDPDDNIAAYVWNFGDGTTYEGGAIEAHGYRTAGTYTVRLTVRDADGAVDKTSTTVQVSGGLYLPFIARGWNP